MNGTGTVPKHYAGGTSIDRLPDQKTFVPLENNPTVMTNLAHKLGLSPELEFHDVYSLTDPDLLAILPRPAHALLFIYPMSVQSEKWYQEDYDKSPEYNESGDDPVLYYRQRITHACGLIGLLHCITNSTRSFIIPGSDLDQLVKAVTPLQPEARARFLHDSELLEAAHNAAAHTGDTEAPPHGECPDFAFIAFTKGSDGHLYELEGRRKGPIDRGLLPIDADVLSEEAVKAGPMPFIERQEGWGDNVMFSCIVLA